MPTSVVKTINALLLVLVLALACVAQAQTFSVLLTFNGANGAGPDGGVLLDDAGNIYGTTVLGGTGRCPEGCGVVYRLDSAGQETVLYTFTGGSDGSGPWAGLALDASGNLYGTAVDGGKRCADSPACGVVFKIIP
jgi:uncharacterized repeat protein (TIGR03803 family)